jgi:hypothetical protein
MPANLMNIKICLMPAAVILPLLVVTPAPAEEQVPLDPPAATEAASDVPGSQGVGVSRPIRAFRNPGTGQIEFSPAESIPLPELSAREQNMLSRSDEGLQSRVLANRAVAVNLQGRFQSMVTAAADQDTGQSIMSCLIADSTHREDTAESENAE